LRFWLCPTFPPASWPRRPNRPSAPGAHHPQFSAEDFAAFTDAHIAALKAGLKLTPAQEKNWPASNDATRTGEGARRACAEWRDRAEEPHERAGEAREKAEERRDVIEGLRQGAKHLTARSTELATRSAELEKLADAAKPLYDSLNDAQKRRLRPLLHASPEGLGITHTKAFIQRRFRGHEFDGMRMPSTAINKRPSETSGGRLFHNPGLPALEQNEKEQCYDATNPRLQNTTLKLLSIMKQPPSTIAKPQSTRGGIDRAGRPPRAGGVWPWRARLELPRGSCESSRRASRQQ